MALVMRRCLIYRALARPVGAQGNDHDGRSELDECSAGGHPYARTMGERT
jgi:hypothetical protein